LINNKGFITLTTESSSLEGHLMNALQMSPNPLETWWFLF